MLLIFSRNEIADKTNNKKRGLTNSRLSKSYVDINKYILKMGNKTRIALEKKQVTFKSPDLSKMQEVVIDQRTRIYISPDADPEEARTRYLARLDSR